MCGGGNDDGQSPELREAYKRKNKALDRYLREERKERDRRKPLWFTALPLMIVAMCGARSSPEKDLDDPDYDAFRISRRARGRKDGPWNRFVPLAGTMLVILGIRRIRSA